MDNNAFVIATRQKYRFNTPQGQLTAEDLWDLPLTSAKGANLDDIAKSLHKQLKEFDSEISFVKPAAVTKAKTDEIQAKFDIAKFVIDTKVAERDANKAAADKAANKQKLLELIAKKQDAVLEGKPLDELLKMVNEM